MPPPPSLNAQTSATPTPLPSPFAQTNTYTYGAPPADNYAGAADPVRIYYASFTPTMLARRTPVTLLAVTSTNVAKLTLHYGSLAVPIPQRAPGQWQGTFPFDLVTDTTPAGNVTLTLTALRADGTSASIPVGVRIAK